MYFFGVLSSDVSDECVVCDNFNGFFVVRIVGFLFDGNGVVLVKVVKFSSSFTQSDDDKFCSRFS